jgi:hypothetical protein
LWHFAIKIIELLIAVVLSAQATDKGVNKATAILFPVANTPEAIYELGETGLKKYIKTIGQMMCIQFILFRYMLIQSSLNLQNILSLRDTGTI